MTLHLHEHLAQLLAIAEDLRVARVERIASLHRRVGGHALHGDDVPARQLVDQVEGGRSQLANLELGQTMTVGELLQSSPP